MFDAAETRGAVGKVFSSGGGAIAISLVVHYVYGKWEGKSARRHPIVSKRSSKICVRAAFVMGSFRIGAALGCSAQTP